MTTTLAAGALDSRLAAVGLAVTLVAACKNTAVALFAAALHLAVVIALVPNAPDLPVVSAGLLGGMLLTPWAISAVLTWSIVVVASVLTAYELGASLWFALIPVVVVSLLLSVITYGLHTRKAFDGTKLKLDDPEAAIPAPRRSPPAKPQRASRSPRRRDALSSMFV